MFFSALTECQIASDQALYASYFEWTKHFHIYHEYTNTWARDVCQYALLNNRAEKPPINIAKLRGAETCAETQ
jgi:hypothetical protein